VKEFLSYDNGTLSQVLVDEYYPQDVVLPFDPTSKI
jgi:hypothetical protein